MHLITNGYETRDLDDTTYGDKRKIQRNKLHGIQLRKHICIGSLLLKWSTGMSCSAHNTSRTWIKNVKRK